LGDSVVALAVADSYQWLYCDSGFASISGATDSLFVPSNGGNYAVEISMNGCVDTSTCQSLFVLSMDNHSTADDFSIYPNPADQMVVLMAKNESGSCNLYSINGELICSEKFGENQKFTLNTVYLPAGVYFLGLVTAQQTRFCKLTVVHN
jgi:hypothetical protein